MEPAEPSRVPNDSARAIADRFARFRTQGNPAFFDALTRHFAGLVDDSCLPTLFEFAITTNERGRALASRLEPGVFGRRALRWRRPRLLDVGCGYGGFLLAFGERGMRTIGIDINDRLLQLARINLEENGASADLVRGDATANHPSFRKSFDLVVANDVVEHVPRLERFVANVRDWLTRRGTAYLEIPNGRCPAFVKSDGHHQLFAITLLGFEEAKNYYGRRIPYGDYDTYNYLDLEGYHRVFAECGLSTEVLPDTLEGVTLEATERQVAALCEESEAGLATVPEELRPSVRERLAAYLSQIDAAPRRTEAERRRFLLDYGASFWRILARRAG